MEFNMQNCKTVFEAADKVYLSTKVTEVSAGVAAISKPSNPSDDSSQVAAVRSAAASNRGQRGKNRRGGAGGNGVNRSGSGSNSSGTNGGGKPNKNVPSNCCRNHKKWAAEAWYCLEPLSCPWVNKIVKKPTTEDNK